MPIREDMSSKIDTSTNSIHAQNHLLDTVLRDREGVKKTTLSRLHDMSTQVTYYEQVISNRMGNVANTANFNKLDSNNTSFKRINNLVLITEELTAEFDGDVAKTLSETGTAMVLPNSIIPNINDYFVMKVYSTYKLFRITEIAPALIEKDSGYEITFSMSKESDNPEEFDITDNVGEGHTYEFDYNHVGTEYRTVFKSDEFKFIRDCREVMAEVSTIYAKAFYNKTLSCMMCKVDQTSASVFDTTTNLTGDYQGRSKVLGGRDKMNVTSFYDNNLQHFINKNDLLSPNEFIIAVTEYYDVDKTYRRSLFSAIETRKISRLTNREHILHTTGITTLNNINQLLGRIIVEHASEAVEMEISTVLLPAGFYAIMDTYNAEKFTQEANPLYTNANEIIIDMIAIFMNETVEGNRNSFIIRLLNILVGEFYDFLSEDEYDDSMDVFYTYPIFIYILKFITRDISSNQYE